MRILIVDDEPNIREQLIRFLKLEGIAADGAENGFSAQRKLSETAYDAIVVDLKMPQMSGLELIDVIRGEGIRLPIIMMSAFGEVTDAVSALKAGASDYLVKPFNPEELVIRLKSLVAAHNLKNKVENSERTADETFIGESAGIRKIKEIITRISDTDSTVLITGESGTGKEVIARRIHATSKVKDGPFVAINIGGVPAELLESELFGAEKGAYTGSVQRKIGMFELANGGTLFLDEIGDMPLPLQVKLLRVLQEKTITRLGSTVSTPISARIVAATNKNLEQMVNDGLFREDLFYRLNVVRIMIPPLRERKEDIPELAGTIIRNLNRRMGKKISGLSPEALNKLSDGQYYGNIRELENILERAMIFAQDNVLEADDIDISSSLAGPGKKEAAQIEKPQNAKPKTLEQCELEAIEYALRRWEGNRTKAAEELGISRRTLIYKIAEYKLDL